jgi:predicted amidohydrolase YtcJ
MPSMPVAGLRPGDREDPADLVVRNARIHTADPRHPAASALTVCGGLIGVVGDDADVAPHIGPDTRVVDAQGRRVIPGLNDSHCHIVRGGLHYVLELRWDGVPSLAQGLRMVRQQAARTPEGQWVRVAGGWSSETVAERRLPSPAELNSAAPDTPVIVTHLYQSAILNRAALRAAGITRGTPDPPGGQIVRGHDGEPTGMLIAAPSALLLYATIAKAPALAPELQRASTGHFLRELNRFGLTSLIDAAGGFQDFPAGYAAVTELAAARELTVRIAYHLFPQTVGQEVDDLRRWATLVRPGDGDAWLRFNGAGENLVWAAADFENFAQPRPELGAYEAQLEAAVRVLRENGWGFRLHATYDETIRRDLAVFEKLAADGLFPGPGRWLFDHAETVSPDSLGRIAALGGSIGVQHRLAYQGETFARRYGAAAAAAAPPLGAMLERGLSVAVGTDATRVSTYNPWVALHWLISGRTVGGVRTRSAAHCVDRETALEMYTAAGARLTGEEDVKGRLSPGCYADLAILTADYFTVAEHDVPLIEAALTVVGGRIVYAAGEFEGLAAPAAAVEPAWSPVAHFGGYQASPHRAVGDGLRQADLLSQAAAESELHRRWRVRRGRVPDVATGAGTSDPCFT